jgi:hypothetical protein
MIFSELALMRKLERQLRESLMPSDKVQPVRKHKARRPSSLEKRLLAAGKALKKM